MFEAQLEVGVDPAEVGRARRWARSRLAVLGVAPDEPLAETTILLVSELVTNAVVHSGRPAVLRMLLSDRPGPDGPVVPVEREGVPEEAVRVEVADASPRPPTRRRPGGDDTGGRGLELVDGLADRWGWRREGGGKRVWCELDRPCRGEAVLTGAYDRSHARAIRT